MKIHGGCIEGRFLLWKRTLPGKMSSVRSRLLPSSSSASASLSLSLSSDFGSSKKSVSSLSNYLNPKNLLYSLVRIIIATESANELICDEGVITLCRLRKIDNGPLIKPLYLYTSLSVCIYMYIYMPLILIFYSI